MDLLPIIHWNISDQILVASMNAMNQRVKFDLEKYNISLDEFIRYNEVLRDATFLLEIIRFAKIYLRLKEFPLTGIGLELGAGIGYFSATLSEEPDVKLLYVVEYASQYVEKIMPIVFEHYARNPEKLQRVVGDFNKLKLDNSSLDFIYELGSLHHSEDLSVTLQECYRVLKPGGVLIAIDRGWKDSTSDEDLQTILKQELNPVLKQRYGFPINKSVTREDWGEHEIRVKEWMDAFKTAGFQCECFVQKHSPFLNRIWKKLLYPERMAKFALLMSRIGIRRHAMYGYYSGKKLFICTKE